MPNQTKTLERNAIDAPIRHPNAEFVLSRDETTQLIAKLINAPFASETLRKSGLPYMLANGRARYTPRHARTKAEQILSCALKRGRTPSAA
jgi:hypothetical protein